MKKRLFVALIGFFLCCGSFFSTGSWGLYPSPRTARASGCAVISKAGATQTTIGSLPDGLESILSESLAANDPNYRVVSSAKGYRALNIPNGFIATIGLHGFTTRSGRNQWGLRLIGWGAGRQLPKISAGRTGCAPNRVAIYRKGLTAWWINSPLGIEQGWTVANRPLTAKKAGNLTLVLRQSGSLRTKAVAQGSSLGVFNTSGHEVLRYTGLNAYDKNGRKLPAHFEATRQYIRVVVCDAGAAYPVRIDPFLQAAKLKASDGQAQDKLGYALAVSADGKTVAAGAYTATIGSHTAQGAVYIFQKQASGWVNGTQTAKLTASDGASTDSLGISVAISADGKTVVAGALNAQIGTHYAQGAVYVFQKPASGWVNGTQTAKLTALNGAATDNLGNSVAISQDATTIAAGAYHALVGNNSSQGAVYVFAKPASGWRTTTQTARLTASDGSIGDLLGSSVAVGGPGGASVVAGAMGKANLEGSAYVFEKPASGWANVTQTAELTASDGGPGVQLGVATAVSADGGTVVAGASGINISQGAVYVFQEPASGWTNAAQTAELTASDGQPYDGLGQSVAVSLGGINIAAGASNAIVGVQSGQGAVYLYKMPTSGWTNATQTAKLTASDGAGQNNFGSSVAISQNATTLITGSPGATIGTNYSQGAVYAFQGPLWQNGIDLGKGWEWVSWFGYFYTNSSQWIYHSQLGWLYSNATSTYNIWFWDPQWQGKGGWWWTTNTDYPWIYSSSKNTWLYYNGKGRLFYNSSTGQWETD
ncbi:MAG: hypothetical protein ACP5IL_03525 [Syntrophobacteraceae bacterium]